MSLSLMRCCATSPVLQEYEAATDSVLSRLGIGVIELDFNCCGYPLRNSSFEAWIRSSARNLALAERAHLDLMTVCACCYGSLKQAGRLLEADASLRGAANAALEGEQLACAGTARVRHLLEVLRDDVGLERLARERTRSLEGIKVACHYGCHLLRPSAVLELDDAAAPSILERLVEATGAESVPWGLRLDCCGSPVAGVNDELSSTLTRAKLRSAREAGADVLCVVCPYCFIQLERVQRALAAAGEGAPPVILVHQLLGLALGLAPEALGMAAGRVPVRSRPAGAREAAP
jgi:heterodisulfide reductase subunit B2